MEEPYWIELNKETGLHELERCLQEYMFGKEGDLLRSPIIVIALLDRDLWKEYKVCFDRYGILSQVIRK